MLSHVGLALRGKLELGLAPIRPPPIYVFMSPSDTLNTGRPMTSVRYRSLPHLTLEAEHGERTVTERDLPPIYRGAPLNSKICRVIYVKARRTRCLTADAMRVQFDLQRYL